MHLEIVTPNGKILEKEIESVIAPGVAGRFQLLNNHADMVSGLEIGVIKISADGTEDYFSCNGGVLEIASNKVSVLTEASEHAESIDVARAEAAKKRAEERLANTANHIDHERARLALYKAMNRISIAKQ